MDTILFVWSVVVDVMYTPDDEGPGTEGKSRAFDEEVGPIVVIAARSKEARERAMEVAEARADKGWTCFINDVTQCRRCEKIDAMPRLAPEPQPF